MADVERIYTIPLRKAFDFPRTKRSAKAVKIVKEFLIKHMKITEDHIVLSESVNSTIWQRGIQKPPRRIKIKVTKEGDKAVARLIDEKVEEKKEIKKEKPKKKPEEEKTEEEIKAEEKKKELEKEIKKEQQKSAAPKKEVIKDLKK